MCVWFLAVGDFCKLMSTPRSCWMHVWVVNHQVKKKKNGCSGEQQQSPFRSTSQRSPPALALISPGWKCFLWADWHSSPPLLSPTSMMHVHTTTWHCPVADMAICTPRVHSYSTQKEHLTGSVHWSALRRVFLFYECVKVSFKLSAPDERTYQLLSASSWLPYSPTGQVAWPRW